MNSINQPHEFIGVPVVNSDPRKNGGEPQIYRSLFNADPDKKVVFDLSYLKDTQGFIGIQTVFIDNALGDGKIYLECADTKQLIIVKAGKQGYFPILNTSRPKFIMWHDGATELKTNVFFINYLIAQGEW